jgi:hypothetical protein
MKLKFLGAAREVTGSKTLVTTEKEFVLTAGCSREKVLRLTV